MSRKTEFEDFSRGFLKGAARLNYYIALALAEKAAAKPVKPSKQDIVKGWEDVQGRTARTLTSL